MKSAKEFVNSTLEQKRISCTRHAAAAFLLRTRRQANRPRHRACSTTMCPLALAASFS
jgi:hypothetical protein